MPLVKLAITLSPLEPKMNPSILLQRTKKPYLARLFEYGLCTYAQSKRLASRQQTLIEKML